MSTQSQLSKIVRMICNIQLGIAMTSLVIMMLVVVLDVSMRYVFNNPLKGSYDIVQITLLIMVYFGISSVIIDRQEIVIDLIDEMISPEFTNILVSIAGFLTTAILIFFFWSMTSPAIDAYNYGDVRLELDLPEWTLWLATFIGLTGSIIVAVFTMFRPIPPKNNQTEAKL